MIIKNISGSSQDIDIGTAVVTVANNALVALEPGYRWQVNGIYGSKFRVATAAEISNAWVGVATVNSGTGISVDNTDPANPIVSSTITESPKWIDMWATATGVSIWEWPYPYVNAFSWPNNSVTSTLNDNSASLFYVNLTRFWFTGNMDMYYTISDTTSIIDSISIFWSMLWTNISNNSGTPTTWVIPQTFIITPVRESKTSANNWTATITINVSWDGWAVTASIVLTVNLAIE